MIERLYKDELPLKAKLAFAAYDVDESSATTIEEDIEEGLADSDADRVVTNDEVRRWFGLVK